MPGASADRNWAAWFLAATLIVLLTHSAAVLPHEFAHSIMARLLGMKAAGPAGAGIRPSPIRTRRRMPADP
jgi:hypothetical protein